MLPRKLAFWINAYNALAIKGILDGSSPRSFFGKAKFFYTDKYEVGGVKTNLYDLAHDILLPLDDARIHFAIVCASRSCPKLRSEAYTADHLDQQLDTSARDFINDETRNRYDRAQKIAYFCHRSSTGSKTTPARRGQCAEILGALPERRARRAGTRQRKLSRRAPRLRLEPEWRAAQRTLIRVAGQPGAARSKRRAAASTEPTGEAAGLAGGV